MRYKWYNHKKEYFGKFNSSNNTEYKYLLGHMKKDMQLRNNHLCIKEFMG